MKKVTACTLLFALAASFTVFLSACSESFTDVRDGQSYCVVQIGAQTWMAENLNYALPGADGAGKGADGAEASSCPDGDNRNCKKMGRLYTWEAAQMACPEGWRLPTREDFDALVKVAGSSAVAAGGSADETSGSAVETVGAVAAGGSTYANAGSALKSTSGWFKKGNGSDDLGFDARPAGYMDASGKFDGIGGYAYFWSATVDGQESAFAHYLFLDFSSPAAEIRSFDKLSARSVRCLKN